MSEWWQRWTMHNVPQPQRRLRMNYRQKLLHCCKYIQRKQLHTAAIPNKWTNEVSAMTRVTAWTIYSQKRKVTTNQSAPIYSKQQQPPPFYGHYTGQPALAGASSLELEHFVGTKYYCLHALADGNQRIQISEKTLEFSSTLSPTTSPYHQSTINYKQLQATMALRAMPASLW